MNGLPGFRGTWGHGSYQSGIPLGWVPMCVTWPSAVHENQTFGKGNLSGPQIHGWYLTKWSVDEGTWPGDWQSLVQVQGKGTHPSNIPDWLQTCDIDLITGDRKHMVYIDSSILHSGEWGWSCSTPAFSLWVIHSNFTIVAPLTVCITIKWKYTQIYQRWWWTVDWTIFPENVPI